jgi:hypothetical protein
MLIMAAVSSHMILTRESRNIELEDENVLFGNLAARRCCWREHRQRRTHQIQIVATNCHPAEPARPSQGRAIGRVETETFAELRRAAERTAILSVREQVAASAAQANVSLPAELRLSAHQLPSNDRLDGSCPEHYHLAVRDVFASFAEAAQAGRA